MAMMETEVRVTRALSSQSQARSCLYLGGPCGPGRGSDRGAQGAKPVWLMLFPPSGTSLPSLSIPHPPQPPLAWPHRTGNLGEGGPRMRS